MTDAPRGASATHGNGEDEARTIEDLVAFRRTRDRSLRNRIVEAHRGLARSIARRFVGRGEPLEDLEQVALLGLVKSVERFDPDRGFAFATFATPTIEGELKRHFRDTTWSVKVPRSIQERRIVIRDAVERLEARLGRSPRIPEIAEAISADVDEVIEAIAAAGAYQTRSLDAPSGPDDDAMTRADRHAAHDPTSELERDALLEAAIDRLPEREATIVRLRFFDDLSQSEIADRVGVSQMHVSRLLRRSLEQMRAYVDAT